MPIQTELLATLMVRLTPQAGSGSVADAIDVWNLLFRRFSPLIGPLSTAVLFERVLVLQAQAFPWLPRVGVTPSAHSPFALFTQLLEDQSPEQMLAANRALLESFVHELADLIGDSLVERFLRPLLLSGDAPENR